MAAGTLARPGTEYGPCAGECNHKDCAETRRMAETECHYCQTRIGYDRRFYQEPDDRLVHASCLEDNIEKER